MIQPPLVPAELALTADGTPFAPAYADVYHSAAGALEQARHVFLAGNDLPARWRQADASAGFVIIETGFGLGLNFLVTWQAWQMAGAPGFLHYVGVEKHPLRHDDLARALARFPELEALSAQLVRQWPLLVPGFHRLHFAAGRVSLTLLFGEAEEQLARLAARYDALYLDGFAPARNPAMWSPTLLATLTRLARTTATLATWSVAGEVRRTLEHLGWRLERRPGFASKREMLIACRHPAVSPAPSFCAPEKPLAATGLATQHTAQHRAIVIGAGLAGTAVCECLARRGWQIELFERHSKPAQEASGNPAGIVLPLMTRDDALAGRLSRACYLHALRRLAELAEVRWASCGVVQIALDAAHERLQRDTVEAHAFPAGFASFLSRKDAEALVGQPLAHGGWWFPGGGWVAPASFCAALLAAAGNRVVPHYDSEIVRLERLGTDWAVFDATGRQRARAPHLILANAMAASRLLPADLTLSLMPIRGQVTYLPTTRRTLPALHHVLCRKGYLTPPAAGTVCVGASFDRNDERLDLRVADHRDNLAQFEALLPGALAQIELPADLGQLGGRVGIRSATGDRLPLAGTVPAPITPHQATRLTLDGVPRETGLHVLLGLGARGMVWAPLLAELLASQLAGEPLPLEHELVAAADPARFQLRRLRREHEARKKV
ncbi:MAG: bifunctional tRNA (5-methylaminomethyl-2-thiouridine)(34)-methyltransferase MnmD/FAD-dependent 5-carboxymethylaminomethyl-2-thiouridine(34) oxidoreductase MnmC [Betaproteobacteria bacterium HGW-Betaproteobacteria-11]|nr:MAG: bifunctional tRNA (5-methylaminomethyl-2-thiouridine)(34)-methyltransferase MnmD/FAD-dependent 5-carboxymethylaminomethyl-2-thiouridine(34) oxidoreductase MnmC [Betaproteobacteria bacterium HGW-Betaproteobacteria-11]